MHNFLCTKNGIIWQCLDFPSHDACNDWTWDVSWGNWHKFDTNSYCLKKYVPSDPCNRSHFEQAGFLNRLTMLVLLSLGKMFNLFRQCQLINFISFSVLICCSCTNSVKKTRGHLDPAVLTFTGLNEEESNIKHEVNVNISWYKLICALLRNFITPTHTQKAHSSRGPRDNNSTWAAEMTAWLCSHNDSAASTSLTNSLLSRMGDTEVDLTPISSHPDETWR